MVPPSLLFINASPIFYKPLSPKTSYDVSKRPRIAHASTVCLPTTHCSLDPLESSVNNGIETNVEISTVENIPDKYQGYLDDSRTVSIPLPLDVFLEETSHGEVYIDEVIEGGNACKSNFVEPGDVIIAVCVPFGDALLPLPQEGGLKMLMSQIGSREDGLEFIMAVRKEDLETLRENTISPEEDEALDFDLIQECCDKIFVDDYPFQPQEKPKEQGLDLEQLREEGFDV